MASIFESKAYKVFMTYVNGWGAAVVIIGALFKIMHFPGASIVLTCGMLVEASIFFLSVFDAPLPHYDWTRVYPILAHSNKAHELGLVPPEKEVKAVSASSALTPAPTSTSAVGLDDEDIKNLKEGIGKFTTSAKHFAEATDTVPGTISKATASFDKLESSLGVLSEGVIDTNRVIAEGGKTFSDKLGSSLDGFAEGCNDTNKVIAAAGKTLTEQILANCEKLKSTMDYSAENFSTFNKLMDSQLNGVKVQADTYMKQIASVNKNISALNAIYELQINETKASVGTFGNIQKDMVEMLENVSLGLDGTKLFRQETKQLANTVASLNSVYGNMLSIVNN
ncbi:hypothetical protein FACS1894199_07840 [Bacteroidia bacterium]|nr:hypothetical protein FACS1894199_07840 [Bacteroidia bacterium]